MRRGLAVNLVIAALGLAIFAALHVPAGRVEANEGLGWDGRKYAQMVTGRLEDGSGATQTRPLLPLLTRIPYQAGLDLVPAFQLMNFLYMAALGLCLCFILDLHGVAATYKAYFVVTVAVCIATSRMYVFYPTLTDLGALAVMSASTLIVLTRNGWPAGAAALLAVTAREFGGAVALFGFHRELRQGRGFWRALVVYAPAVCAVFLLRAWSRATNLGGRRQLAPFEELVAGFASLVDPVFIAFFAYFMITLLGGITLLLVLRPVWTTRQFRTTPELATFTLPLVAAAAIGGADIWRYEVFLLPALALLFAAYVRAHQPGVVLLSAAFLATVVTQQPFAPMDMVQYFRDWFPIYLYQGGAADEAFWSTWHRRFLLTGILAVALGLLQWIAPRVRARSSESALAVDRVSAPTDN